ncbi:leucine-rich repeat domain-containing protein [Wenyingzhuangia sp. IMCC45574]
MLRYLYILLFALCATSCKTFDTFYGKTDTVKALTDNTTRVVFKGGQVLPEEAVLKELRMLQIKDATQVEVEEFLGAIPNPTKLRVLMLDSLDLSFLPQNVQRFSNLEQLSLASNPNLNLEKTFKELSLLNLSYLNLSNNNIKSLPKSLSQLTSIEDLNLSYNRIHSGENFTVLSGLEKLQLLWLDANELKVLPRQIGELSNLKRLFLDHNYLTEFPEEMQKMRSLRVLHLGNNRVTEYPKVFYKMRTLILLHINNNRISNLSKEYKSNRFNIKGIVLDGNPLPKQEKEWIRKNFKSFFLLSI